MNTKTITLTGEETAVKLDRTYPYIWVRNLGSGDVYMSLKPGIVPGEDGVVTVPASGGRSSGDVGQIGTLYFLGSGKIEISPQFNAACPFFKSGSKGGDSGGGSSDYSLPVASENILGGIKSGGDITVSESGEITVNSVNGKKVGTDVPENAKFTDTTYSNATSSNAGLMSAADKNKLDNLNSGGYQCPYYIQAGTVNVGQTPKAVYYPVKYKSTPYVVATTNNSTNDRSVQCQVIGYDRVSINCTDNATVAWVAFGII